MFKINILFTLYFRTFWNSGEILKKKKLFSFKNFLERKKNLRKSLELVHSTPKNIVEGSRNFRTLKKVEDCFYNNYFSTIENNGIFFCKQMDTSRLKISHN